MNKQLLASTAIVAAGMLMAASQANAQGKTVKLGLRGYMDQVIGLSFDRSKSEPTTAASNSRTSFDQGTESEIHFKGSGKLDNGITILADVQLEVGGAGEIIDEQHMTIRGGFGQLILGSEDNAGHLMTIGYTGSWPTGVGQSLTFDRGDWIALPAGMPGNARFDGTLNDARLRSLDNDSSKVSYFTPRFSGFQVGVSYIPNFEKQVLNPVNGGSLAKKDSLYHEGWAFGANYNGKFDKVGVGIAVGYLTAKSAGTNSTRVENTTGQTWKDTDDMSAVSGGIRLDFGNFRVAAGFKHNEDAYNAVTANATTSRSLNGTIFDLGARYKMGPNMMSIGYSNGRMEGEMGGGNEEEQGLMFSYARILGAGVKWHANLMWADFEDDLNRNSTTVKGTNSGWAMTTGLRLTF
jgi:predicted porin